LNAAKSSEAPVEKKRLEIVIDRWSWGSAENRQLGPKSQLISQPSPKNFEKTVNKPYSVNICIISNT
jgi:hypothetical protein